MVAVSLSARVVTRLATKESTNHSKNVGFVLCNTVAIVMIVHVDVPIYVAYKIVCSVG